MRMQSAVAHAETPRLAMFLPDLAGGGAEGVCLELGRQFLDSDIAVDYVLARRAGPLLDTLDSRAGLMCATERATTSGLLLANRSYSFLKEHLRDQPPDVLMSTLTGANLVATAAWLAAERPCRLVLREANTIDNTRNPVMRALRRRLYPRADCIIAISRDVARDLVAHAGVASKRVRVIHNPINVDAVLSQAQHAEPRNADRPLIVSAGRLTPQKDFATLIRAFAHVVKRRDAELVILGEGPERTALTALARDLGVLDCVSLPGWIPEPYPLFAVADAFVLTSRWEGFGQVLIEALALGIPVIATACPGGPREILQDGRIGPLVPVGDADRVASAILATLKSPPDRLLLRQRAADFGIDTIAAQYAEVLFS